MMPPTVSHRSDGWSYHHPQPVLTALTAMNGDWLLLAGSDWWLHKANRSEGVMRTVSSPRLLLESLVYPWRWVVISIDLMFKQAFYSSVAGSWKPSCTKLHIAFFVAWLCIIHGTSRSALTLPSLCRVHAHRKYKSQETVKTKDAWFIHKGESVLKVQISMTALW